MAPDEALEVELAVWALTWEAGVPEAWEDDGEEAAAEVAEAVAEATLEEEPELEDEEAPEYRAGPGMS